NTLYSPFVRWSEIAKEWLDAQGDDEKLQNFINSWLAEPWENEKKRTDADTVLARQTEVPENVIPAWARLLTGGVDVQESSLYWSIRAWGPFMTSQNIAHGQALGWDDIERIMNLNYPREDGGEMLVDLALIDSGNDTETVYDFCLKNAEWALPVKGSSREMGSSFKISVINKADSRAEGVRLVLVDGGKYKDMIASRMNRENGRGSWMVHADCDREYAEQVTAEHKVKGPNGKEIWVPRRSHADNHYLDTEVYNAAAADLLGVRALYLQDEQPKVKQDVAPESTPAPEENWIQKNENWI
ncbi:MAG: phage terminase large subunit family protein, partial [Butyricicoccus sp.]|nr:phage terminase large subunit family protein [Butyricicoccus sp.]